MTQQLKQFAKRHNLTEGQCLGTEKVEDFLYLSSLTSIPEGFNPTVGGSLDLRSLTSIPEGFNPTVGGILYLGSLTSIPEGFNPTVGGFLDLSSLTSIPEGFNPTVGGSLDLGSLTSIPEGFNPTVGRSLVYADGREKYIGARTPTIPRVTPRWGEKYICADGIMTEIISHKANVYRVRKVARKEIEYLITDGVGNWAHGETLEEAKEDLIFKITDRKKSDYEDLTAESELTHEDAIRCYRVITGACSAGTKHFVKSILGDDKKERYTIKEIAELTRGQYGHSSFVSFFKL